MYQDNSITNPDVSSWPILSETQSSPGLHDQTFSYSQTIKVLTDLISLQINTQQLGPKPKLQNPPHHYTKDGIYQIWDTYLWVLPTIGQLSQKAVLCQEQRNHTYDTWAKCTRHLGRLSLEICSEIIVLQATDWFATDWVRCPGIRWTAPDGTHWLCGTNLWPWLPPGWIGRCTLGFAWIHGRDTKIITTPANLPV